MSNNKSDNLIALIEAYNQCRGTRVYIPISELERCYRTKMNLASDKQADEIIVELRQAFPKIIKFDKERRIPEAVVRIIVPKGTHVRHTT